MVNCYAWYTESERRGTSPHPPFKGGKSGAKRWGNRRTPSAFVPSASGGEPTEQRAGRKKIRLSEAKQVT